MGGSPFALDAVLFQPAVDPSLGPSTAFPQTWSSPGWEVWSGAGRRFNLEDLEEIQVFVTSPWGGLTVRRYGPPVFQEYDLAVGRRWAQMGWAVQIRAIEVEGVMFWTPGILWGAGWTDGLQTLDMSAEGYLDTLTPWTLRLQYRWMLGELTPALAVILEEGQPLTLSAALVQWIRPELALGLSLLNHPPSYAVAVSVQPSDRILLTVEDRIHPLLGHTPSLWFRYRGQPLSPGP